MSFSLQDALRVLRCPRTGQTLTIEGAQLVSEDARRYPIIDGIADLTLDADKHTKLRQGYDRAAGAKYNLWIYNPAAMAFTWGLGVLKVPLRMRPSRELSPGVNIEVPCGTGIFTARAYRDNPRSQILAVDYSMGMLRAARQRARELGVDNAVFIRADVAQLPIADACLDGGLSLAGFHAFPDPAAAAMQLARVLAPGAPFATTIACSEARRISDIMIERVMKPGGFFSHGLPARTYCEYLRRAGFDDLRVEMAGAVMIAHARRHA